MTREWRNHVGNQVCHPRDIRMPESVDDIVAAVREAEADGTTIRAVGSGHAWSDIALTEGLLLRPHAMTGILPLDDGTLRPRQACNELLVRVLAGTTIRDLNDALDARGLGLPNMGGYDAQTIAGVISTSTHGSGLSWGPFSDMVRSVDLVVSGGRQVRVEPAGGLTDPTRFNGERLIQDDRTFDAAICGLGTLGIVTSLVLSVRERFFLNEVRTLSTWERERDRLGPHGPLADGDHYELLLNPYPRRDGHHRLLVTRRTECPDPARLAPDKKRRHPLIELQTRIPLTKRLLRWAARRQPRVLACAFDGALKAMQDDGYAAISYRVFNIGEANGVPALSMELAVPLEGGAHVQAVDRILEIAARERQRGLIHTVPIALRFTKASRAFASMMYGRDTMMIELILIDGTRGGTDLLETYERELADLGTRSHWGQYNALTPERVRAAYPKLDEWLAVAADFNASGVFASPFTKRVGL